MLLLLVWGPHFEDQSSNGKLVPSGHCFPSIPLMRWLLFLSVSKYNYNLQWFWCLLYCFHISPLHSLLKCIRKPPDYISCSTFCGSFNQPSNHSPFFKNVSIWTAAFLSSIISASILGVLPSAYMTLSLFLSPHPLLSLSSSNSLDSRPKNSFSSFLHFPCTTLALATPSSVSSGPGPKKTDTTGKTKKHRAVLLVSTLNIWFLKYQMGF